jgi:hypothetical protein
MRPLFFFTLASLASPGLSMSLWRSSASLPLWVSSVAEPSRAAFHSDMTQNDLVLAMPPNEPTRQTFRKTTFTSLMRCTSKLSRIPCLIIVASGFFAVDALAQAPAVAANPVGIWRGTSVCRLRPSPCKDEVALYRITRGKTSDSLSVDGRKIVNGQEVQMGILACSLDTSGTRFTCSAPNGVWHFAVRGDSLVGELRLPDNTKYRDVSTARWH